MQIVKAAVLYFLIVFAAGWVCGPLRELIVVPRFGRTVGLLAEAPLMLIAMALAARWISRRLAVITMGARAAVGLIALALLLAIEAASLHWMRGISAADYVAGHDLAAGLITLALFALFAAMPALVGRH